MTYSKSKSYFFSTIINATYIKNLIFISVGVILFCNSPQAQERSVTTAPPNNLENLLTLPASIQNELDKEKIPVSAISIVVHNAQQKLPSLAINADKPFNPASVFKLLTTAVALDVLAPDYFWKTDVLARVGPSNGVLAGDLYIKGGGDPKLTIEDFWQLLQRIRALGVRKIKGDVVFDQTLFNLPPANAGDFDGETLRAYNVEPQSLIVNFNTIRLTLKADTQTQNVIVYAQPHPTNLIIKSEVKYNPSADCGNWKNKVKVNVSKTTKNYQLLLQGTFPASCNSKDWYLAPMDSGDYLYGVFTSLWRELGGEIYGSWRNEASPANAILLARHESKPLTNMIEDINKFSNNLMARMVFLTLAQNGKFDEPATLFSAQITIMNWLKSNNISTKDIVLDNGAGLSRTGRISANQLIQILKKRWHNPLMPEFVASLPISATDGTMRNRKLPQYNMHIKTGSIDFVQAIAGYVLDKNSQMQLVVMLVNHQYANKSKNAQDALLNWVYEGQVW